MTACRAPEKASLLRLCLLLSIFTTLSVCCYKADWTLQRQLFPALRWEQWWWILLPSPQWRSYETGRTSFSARLGTACLHSCTCQSGVCYRHPSRGQLHGAVLLFSGFCATNSGGNRMHISSQPWKKAFDSTLSRLLLFAEALAPCGCQRDIQDPLLQLNHIWSLRGCSRKDSFGTSLWSIENVTEDHAGE